MGANDTSKRIRLPFLDGLRGWSALYVVVVHACYGAFPDGSSGAWSVFEELFSYGRLAVSVFIVLSGFCLMLPLAVDPDRIRGQAWGGYFKRRFRRIVPTYLAAMGLSLLLLAVLPKWMTQHGWGNSFWPVFEADILLSHVFLIHNLSNDWITRINPPFWSVATEWQIYFLFPLVLLPMFRRMGWLASVLVGFGLGLGVIFLFRRFETAAPWFLGLFALGMAVAQLAVAAEGALVRHRRVLGHPVVVAAGLLAVITVVTIVGRVAEFDGWKGQFTSESIAGVACACFLLWLCGSDTLRAGDTPCRSTVGHRVAWFFETRCAGWLGKVSYSLYLTHALMLMITAPLIDRLGMTGGVHALMHISVAVTASLLFAWLFYQWFERPFVAKKSRTVKPETLPLGALASTANQPESAVSRG